MTCMMLREWVLWYRGPFARHKSIFYRYEQSFCRPGKKQEGLLVDQFGTCEKCLMLYDLFLQREPEEPDGKE